MNTIMITTNLLTFSYTGNLLRDMTLYYYPIFVPCVLHRAGKN